MQWNFDMSDAPRHGYDDEEKGRDVLIAISGVKRVVVSRWVPEDYTNKAGRWMNVRPDEDPLAWCEIEYPSAVVEKAPAVSLPSSVAPAVALPTAPAVALPTGIPGVS